MVSSLIFLLLCGNIALNLGNAQKLPKGKRPNLKVYINTTGDSILMKFLRPDPNTKLEGFLLGYGSNSHSNQYFPLPAEGKSSQAEVDAEPKYLIVVRPVPPPSQKKKCSGKSRTRQPLQMVVGTLSPSSVFLSWGFLINPQYDWTLPSQCPNDRLYTVRYREKDKEKKWIFQICPATETVVENLKPNTIYEFGVKDNLEGGLWSRIFNHKTVVGTKNKGNGKIQSTYDQTHIVPAYIPKKIIPITIIKQVIQNVTHRAASKSPDRPSVGGTILVHLIIPGLNETTPKGSPPIMLDISETVKTLLAKNETLAIPVESKIPEEGKIPAQPVPVTMETVQRTTSPTMTSVIEISETTLAPNKLPEFPQAKTPFSLAKPRATLASDQIQWIVPTAKTSDGLKVLQPHPATHDMQPVLSSTPTTDEPEISITQTAATTTLDSAPSKTSRTIEQPRATLAPNEVPLLPQKPKIYASPEIQHTTLASTQTTSIPSTPKRRRPIIRPTGSKRVISSTISESTPKPKPTSHGLKRPTATLAQESVSAETTSAPSSPRSPTTIALPKTKRPGHRRRPKTTPSPKASLTQSALESVTLTTETTKTTLASKSPRSKTRSRKVKTTPRTSTIQTISAYEPVTHRTEASMTTLASQLDQSSPHTDPQLKRTLSPDVPEIKTAPGPGTVIITHSPTTTLVMESSTFKTDTMVTTIAPGPGTVIITHSPTTTLAKIKTKPSHRKRPRPKTTVKPEKSQTKSVLTTALEPATLRTVTPAATLAPKVPTKTRRPRPGPGPHPRPHPRPRLPQTTTPSTEVPQTKPAPTEVQTNLFQTTSPYLEKPPITPAHKPIKQNRTKSPSHSKLKTTPSLPVPQTKPVSKIELESVAFSTTSPKATIAPKGPHYVHPIPKTSQSPDEQQTKAVLESITYVSEPPMETIASIETTPVPSKTLALPKPDAPQTKTAPKKTTHAPPKMKTTPASVKPATKVSRPVTSKPKISPRPHASSTLPAPTERHISSSSQPSLSPIVSPTTSVPEENTIRIKQPKTTLAPITITLRTATPTIAPKDVHKPDSDVSQTKPVLEPVTFKIEPSKPTMAPIGTKSIPVKPKISPSPSQDVLQTTLAKTVHSTQEPATTKIPRKPKRTKTTQAPNKVYTTTIRKRPVRPDKNRTIAGADRFKPNGISQDTDYIKPSSGDINKHISAPKNVSLDATKKPGTVAKTHHPILPPPKPTRRKLQPQNVTGKPGSTGTILLPRVTSPPPKVTVKPTGPTMPKKIETEKKQPTASVTGEYGNLTDFSSSPTRETDSLGNQRFVAPHVRYIPKPENEPCSITDSMKRFPTEEVSEESPTSPPQNPPTNLTVVTVEGCSSFVILDWEKPQNDTVTEYEIRSKENGAPTGKKESIQTTNQTFSTIENLKPNTSYEFQVTPRNPLGEGPPSTTVSFSTESADPRVSEPISAGRDAIWTEIPFKSDSYSECKGKQYVKRTWYKKFVGVQLCNSLRYKIYLSDSLTGKFYNIGDQRGHGEDHCQFVDSFLDGRTGQQLNSDQLPIKEGYFRAVRQEPVQFGEIGGYTQINYVQWYECGTTIPGKW
ncbi:target of Nesh-SH3 isoform X4 [Sarcophilus harrisii]|uniref:target of Nesh-SH3 isoform X4 n=1 Tax=Sarcophilus harrisii TaxID=9305 RepID=UPI001301AE83|nr:target of Nesh-SH3 isoform X4 [Sarcophilus harrisii]